MTESVTQKAQRLLIEGKVRITGANQVKVYADVQGDNGEYMVAGIRDQFGCSCANVKNQWSHIEAVKMIWKCR